MAQTKNAHVTFRRKVTQVLKRYTIHFYVATAVLYGLMIPASILVFPSTTLLVTIIVLFSGLTTSVASLASVLVDMDQSDMIDDLQDDVDELQEGV